MSYYFTSLEICKQDKPNWQAAKDYIKNSSEKDLAIYINNTFGSDLDVEDPNFVFNLIEDRRIAISLEVYFQRVIRTCISIFEGCWETAIIAELHFTNALICVGEGDPIKGDAPDGFWQIELFRNSGAAKAAGFLVKERGKI